MHCLNPFVNIIIWDFFCLLMYFKTLWLQLEFSECVFNQIFEKGEEAIITLRYSPLISTLTFPFTGCMNEKLIREQKLIKSILFQPSYRREITWQTHLLQQPDNKKLLCHSKFFFFILFQFNFYLRGIHRGVESFTISTINFRIHGSYQVTNYMKALGLNKAYTSLKLRKNYYRVLICSF